MVPGAHPASLGGPCNSGTPGVSPKPRDHGVWPGRPRALAGPSNSGSVGVSPKPRDLGRRRSAATLAARRDRFAGYARSVTVRLLSGRAGSGTSLGGPTGGRRALDAVHAVRVRLGTGRPRLAEGPAAQRRPVPGLGERG